MIQSGKSISFCSPQKQAKIKLEKCQASLATRRNSYENHIIPHSLDTPAHDYDNFHEEGHTGQVYVMYYSVMDVGIISPVDLQFIPTSLGKRAIKEKMINGLFDTIITKHTKTIRLDIKISSCKHTLHI